MTRPVLLVVAVCACDPQVDGSYAGDPIARVRGVATGFSADDAIDGGQLRWNTQVGVDLHDGPVTAVPASLLPPSGIEIDIIDAPNPSVGFGFGDGVTIAEGHLFLVDGATLMGDAIDYALIYVDDDVADGTTTAAYLDWAPPRGYHLCIVRPTVELPPAQEVLAQACGGTPECASQRRYQLEPADHDLGTEVQFFRAGP